MSNMMNTTKVVTGKVRLSYAHIWEAYSSEQGKEPKFSTAILIPKTDGITLKKIADAVEAAKINDKSKLAASTGQLPFNLKLPLRDGDAERPDDEAYRGMFFLNASSKQRPQVVDINLNDIITPAEVYSGCYCRVSLNFYGFSMNGNKGIAVGLNNIQKLQDGEPLAGGSSAADDFGDAYVDQSQQAYTPPVQQQAYTPPVQQQAYTPPVQQQAYTPPNNGGGGLLD